MAVGVAGCGVAEAATERDTPVDRAMTLLLVLVASALLAYCTTFLVTHRALVARLFHAASLAHHERMSAPRPGEAVFYVWHENPVALAAFVAAGPGALGHTFTPLDDAASVTFAEARDPAVARLREDPGVTFTVNRDTALLCR